MGIGGNQSLFPTPTGCTEIPLHSPVLQPYSLTSNSFDLPHFEENLEWAAPHPLSDARETQPLSLTVKNYDMQAVMSLSFALGPWTPNIQMGTNI